MITLKLENLFKVGSHGLTEKEIKEKSNFLPKFVEKVKASPQGFFRVIDDKKTIKEIKEFAKSVKGKFKYIVVLGIGGSALGTICLQKNLKPLTREFYVLDNIDPSLISEVESQIELKETLFIVVTKSGETIETLTQYFYFRKKCEEKRVNIKEHFIFITDPKKGPVREFITKEKFTSFEIPENVGGRFSALTAVSLLPAALIGIDPEKIISGAKVQRTKFLNTNFKTNLSFQFALAQYLLNLKGKNINILLPYAEKLVSLNEWYKQLLAESIGKKENRQGKRVNTGITPISALGVTDQHSQNQLYNDGPNDKLIIFFEVDKLGPKIVIPNVYPKNAQFKIFNKKITFNKLLQIEKEATSRSLTENNRPNLTIKLDEINETTLGELMMFFEGSIAFLGEFYNINPYDQPGVELTKKITKQILLKEYGNSKNR